MLIVDKRGKLKFFRFCEVYIFFCVLRFDRIWILDFVFSCSEDFFSRFL